MYCKTVFFLVIAGIYTCAAQESEFANLVKDLLQGDELKKFTNAYSSLPLEVRDKLTKDLLTNPGKLGKDMLNLLGPQVQNLLGPQISNLLNGLRGVTSGNAKQIDNEVDVEVDDMNMDYSKDGNPKRRPPPQQGIDFGPLTSMLGNMISNNPQMLVSVAQNLLQSNGQGFSFESITNMLTEQFDLDTMLSMASALGAFPSSSSSSNKRGEGEPAPSKGIAEMLQLQQFTKMWADFIRSPIGQKVNRVLPRLIKSESLPDALRLLEKETSFRFDMILRQLQDPNFRKIIVAQTVKPIGQFMKSITIPNDFKEVLTKADDILNNKLGLGVKAKEYIEPVFIYIRDTFKITRDSLLDLKPEDIEKIASDVLHKEILEPLTSVWDAYEKARQNSQCAQFIFCQLNYNFYPENFIRRHVIKTSSIISAFQASAVMKKDAFSQLYESVHQGADGYDCTHGVNSFCLDLMQTAHHNEL